MPPLQLIRATTEDKEALLTMIAVYEAAGDRRYRWMKAMIERDYTHFLHWLAGISRGLFLAEDQVPEVIYWLQESGGRLVGSSRLRLQLNERLLQEGGHIGYDIMPGERGRGLGKALLALTLAEARARKLRRVLLTCDAANMASARIIEKNGGVLESQIVAPSSGELHSRYWIELA